MNMDQLWLSFRLLLLLAAANLSPIVAKRVLGPRWSMPLDGGVRFFDGRPLLGPSKTIRGVIAATVATTFAAPVLGIPIGLGALLGVAAMTGDALSSFIKRRLGAAPSARAVGLDQVPEALLPLLAIQRPLDLTLVQIVGITLLFFMLEIPFARLFHRLGIRETPY